MRDVVQNRHNRYLAKTNAHISVAMLLRFMGLWREAVSRDQGKIEIRALLSIYLWISGKKHLWVSGKKL